MLGAVKCAERELLLLQPLGEGTPGGAAWAGKKYAFHADTTRRGGHPEAATSPGPIRRLGSAANSVAAKPMAKKKGFGEGV